MDQNALSEVIEVEKEIQKSLDLEKAKCRERLEQVGKEVSLHIAKEEEKIRDSFRVAAEREEKDARRKSLQLVDEAAKNADRIFALGDDALTDIVMKKLGIILETAP